MSIKLAEQRNNVQIHFPNGNSYNGPIGATVEQFLEVANLETNGRIVACLINGKLRELSQRLYQDSLLHPVTMADSDGVRIYRRSLSFLTMVAARKLFPCPINIQHSMPFGGYYCERSDGLPVSEEELIQLKKLMTDLVEAKLPINQVQLPLEDALQFFRDTNQDEKADLFTKRRKDYLTLYELDGVRDNFHGFMVPNTRYLNIFTLHRYANGFIFHFPRRQEPDKLQPFEDEPWLAKVFQDYDEWLSLVGVPTVPALNQAITDKRSQEVVLVAEAMHARQLTTIAQEIANRKPKIRVVLISGPTSAGKTTFSKRLAVQLIAQGIQPAAIAMDNYFVNREQTPRDENGDFDYESIDALDVPTFVKNVNTLLAGEQIIQPHYNFHTGRREIGEPLQINTDRIIIIEGIHGLNPRLVSGIPPESIYRIFISAFTQLNLDRHNRIPTTDTRLLRRIVRDAAHRGYSASDTIQRWQSVRRGEKTHIFPFQHHADAFFNSALVYELSVLKTLAQPLLLQVEPETPERVEANRLLAFLQWFDAMPSDIIPHDSILREFVGGSIMEQFEPWRQN